MEVFDLSGDVDQLIAQGVQDKLRSFSSASSSSNTSSIIHL